MQRINHKTIFDFHLCNIRNTQQIKSQNRQWYRSISLQEEYGLWISCSIFGPRAFSSSASKQTFGSHKTCLTQTIWTKQRLQQLEDPCASQSWSDACIYLCSGDWKKTSLSNLFCFWPNAAVSVFVDVFDAVICVEWSPCFQQGVQWKKCCTLEVWLYVLVCTVCTVL